MADYTPSAEFSIEGAEYTPSGSFDLDAETELESFVDAVLQKTLTRLTEVGAVTQWVGLIRATEVWAGINPAPLPTLLSAALQAARSRQTYLRGEVAGLRSLQTYLLADLATTALLRLRGTYLDAELVLPLELRASRLGAVVTDHLRLAVYPDAWLLGSSAQERRYRLRIDANFLPLVTDMSLSFSTGLRNHLLGRYSQDNGDGLGGAMHNCYIDIYEGSKPASPDYSTIPSILLGTVSQGGYSGPDWGGSWREPENASIEKNRSEPWVMYPVRAGTAGWFRMRLIDDEGGYSSTAHRIDGTIGTTTDFDLVVPNPVVQVSTMVEIDIFKMLMRQEN